MQNITAKICEWIGLPGAVILALLVGASWLVIGCSTDKQPGSIAGEGTAPAAKSGAELWAENCVRCHNIYTVAQFVQSCAVGGCDDAYACPRQPHSGRAQENSRVSEIRKLRVPLTPPWNLFPQLAGIDCSLV